MAIRPSCDLRSFWGKCMDLGGACKPGHWNKKKSRDLARKSNSPLKRHSATELLQFVKACIPHSSTSYTVGGAGARNPLCCWGAWKWALGPLKKAGKTGGCTAQAPNTQKPPAASLRFSHGQAPPGSVHLPSEPPNSRRDQNRCGSSSRNPGCPPSV